MHSNSILNKKHNSFNFDFLSSWFHKMLVPQNASNNLNDEIQLTQNLE